MEYKGIALISNNIKHRNRIYVGGIEKYEGKILVVFDKSVINGDCLCISDDNLGLGDIHSEDVSCFLPIVKKQGVMIPADLSFIEEIIWLAEALNMGINKFNFKYSFLCIEKQQIIRDISTVIEQIK